MTSHNLMPLVHHARRLLAVGAPAAVLRHYLDEMVAAYIAGPDNRSARLLKVEIDRFESII